MRRATGNLLLIGGALVVHFTADRLHLRGGFARNHLDDVLAPLLLLPFAGLWSRPHPGICAFLHGGLGVMVMIAIASVAWEVVTPALLARSTGDPLDALCYVGGGLVFWIAHRVRRGWPGSDDAYLPVALA